ncbi:hypothetical protein I4U23_027363 [Adineta vaga]|nr:hypothetical protein I4U23_027363 [Adineta vaga]
MDATSGITVMNTSTPCYGLFIDTNNSLYCSFFDLHKVTRIDLNENSTTPITIAGNDTDRSTSSLLNHPCGIFVDIDFTLYVADSSNHRIQRLNYGELNGTTVAGVTTANTTISLNIPTGIVLDGNGYLFIMDTDNFRIVASNFAGF